MSILARTYVKVDNVTELYMVHQGWACIKLETENLLHCLQFSEIVFVSFLL